MNINLPSPRHGEVWLVSFEPQVGKEIKKTRPAIVLSSNDFDVLPLRTVAPIREYRLIHRDRPFLVPVSPTAENGLSKLSSVDVSQLHAFDLSRFIRQIGTLHEDDLGLVKGACIMALDLH